MAYNPIQSPDGKQHVSDTKQTAPGKLLLWIVPIALLAIVVMLVGMHFLGGTK